MHTPLGPSRNLNPLIGGVVSPGVSKMSFRFGVLKAHPLGSPAMTVDSCRTERLSTSDLAVATQVDVLPPPELPPPPPLLTVPLPEPLATPALPEALDPEVPPGGTVSPFSSRVHDEAIATTSPRTMN